MLNIYNHLKYCIIYIKVIMLIAILIYAISSLILFWLKIKQMHIIFKNYIEILLSSFKIYSNY